MSKYKVIWEGLTKRLIKKYHNDEAIYKCINLIQFSIYIINYKKTTTFKKKNVVYLFFYTVRKQSNVR